MKDTRESREMVEERNIVMSYPMSSSICPSMSPSVSSSTTIEYSPRSFREEETKKEERKYQRKKKEEEKKRINIIGYILDYILDYILEIILGLYTKIYSYKNININPPYSPPLLMLTSEYRWHEIPLRDIEISQFYLSLISSSFLALYFIFNTTSGYIYQLPIESVLNRLKRAFNDIILPLVDKI